MAFNIADEYYNNAGTGTDPYSKIGGDPAKKATPQEIERANEIARDLARRKRMMNPEDVNVGGALPPVEYKGKLYDWGTPLPDATVAGSYKPIPRDAVDAFTGNDGRTYFIDPHTGDAEAMHPSNLSLPQFKKGNKTSAAEVRK